MSESTVPTPGTDFAAFVTNLTEALDVTTSAAARFPDKSDLSFERTLDRGLAKGLDNTGQRVLALADRMLALTYDPSASSKKGKGRVATRRRELADEDDVMDSFRASVVDVVDGLLEDADTNLDEVTGARKKTAIDIKPAAEAAAGRKLPNPLKMNTRLPDSLTNADLSKPQLHFRDPIDNSPHWAPTLATKPHAMVPLDFVVSESAEFPFDDDPNDKSPHAVARRQRELASRRHPYYYETHNLPYPTSMFLSASPHKPSSFKETPFEFVDSPEALDRLISELKNAKEIAVDLEYHQIRSYYGFICLMQISTRERDWVIDAIALRGEIRDSKLGDVFTDPSIVKIFHGADSDIVWLQQDFDIYLVNLFDTYHAAKVLEFPQFSLASLLSLYCDFEADKRYQMADWRLRPLPEPMLAYARSDTHFLLYIYDNLRNALLARSSRSPTPTAEGEGTPKPNPQRAIRDVLDRSAETALKLYKREPYDEEKGGGFAGWANVAKKLGKKDVLDSQVGWVFKAIHKWRDALARDLDESSHYLLPNYVLIQLANLQPKSSTVVSRMLEKQAHHLINRSQEIADIVINACQDYVTTRATKSNSTSDTAIVAPSPPNKKARMAPAPKVQVRSSGGQSVVDVWGDVIAGRQPHRTTQSALFGAAIGAPKAGRSPTPPSSLFGSTLPAWGATTAKARRGSPGFEAVRRGIHISFAPAPPPPATNLGPKSVSSRSLPEPETVPFVPAAERQSRVEPAPAFEKNNGATTELKSGAGKPSAIVDEDGIVSVKKKKGKKNKGSASGSTAPSAPPSALPSASSSKVGSVAPEDMEVPKTDKQKKQKVRPEDIPAFDYNAEPSLLDAAPKPKPTKTKKAKKQKGDGKAKPQGTEFGRAPSDMSAPKRGNKSVTFTGK